MNPQSEAVALSLDNELDYQKMLLSLLQTQPGLVLDILKPDMDYFAAEFLKRDPAVFIQLAKQQISGIKNMIDITNFMVINNLVGAIKALRVDTGLGLKEAKDIIVAARDILVAQGKLSNATVSPRASVGQTIALSGPLQATCNAIVAAFK